MNLKECKKLLKNKNNQSLAIILIIGVVLILISGTGETTNDKKTPRNKTEEQRLEEILSDIHGAGEVSVMITYYASDEEKNKAKGVVITADGCRDPSIKSALTHAAGAALDLPTHKVCVYLKK